MRKERSDDRSPTTAPDAHVSRPQQKTEI